MNSDFADGLWERIRILQRRNDYLHDQNIMLQDALDTICAAFLNNSTGLDTAIQTAMALQHRVRHSSDQIRRADHRRDLEID